MSSTSVNSRDFSLDNAQGEKCRHGRPWMGQEIPSTTERLGGSNGDVGQTEGKGRELASLIGRCSAGKWITTSPLSFRGKCTNYVYVCQCCKVRYVIWDHQPPSTRKAWWVPGEDLGGQMTSQTKCGSQLGRGDSMSSLQFDSGDKTGCNNPCPTADRRDGRKEP
ncbi:hypothetical protein BS17DRAFT_809396 [Gyrodon lividus]|nr:hypothetical protein BS17DRAFT_809396 [Gyrodon lividus]